jgi:hypothetical protein
MKSGSASKPHPDDMRAIGRFLICCAALLAAGCAGYKLGPTNGMRAGEKTIQVVPFSNQTAEPRLADSVTSAVRKQLQRDGTFRLATREPGDVVVRGVIVGYRRVEQSLAPDDLATAQDYRVLMTADITATDRATGKILLQQPVTGYTLIHVGNDLTVVERQALSLLADDLAKNVTALLVDGSW